MAPTPLQPTRTTQLVRSRRPRTRPRHGPHRVLRARHRPRDRSRHAPLAARGDMVRLGDQSRRAFHSRVCRAVCRDELFLVWFIWLGRLCVFSSFFKFSRPLKFSAFFVFPLEP
jgi:hypothetical protein